MRTYPNYIPDWFSNLFSGYHWHGEREDKVIYLTFDDGPTPVVTEFVLNQLSKHNFKATFFCIGNNVQRFPEIYHSISKNGHQLGNHTQHHLNAWKTNSEIYLNNVVECTKCIDSKLFRPPYGRITYKVTQQLLAQDFKIILWDVLAGDFDQNRTVSSCLENLKKNTKSGSVVVFHDSEKSFEKLKEILPEYLTYIKNKGWISKSISF